MSLAEEIAAKAKEIHSDGYSMSLGELANLYRDGELQLHPEFQRQFRWTEKQKSNLIESVMLGIPLPPIFVVQEENGVWDVIDGLQRLSTFFEFMGILRERDGSIRKPSTLMKTKFLPSLEGKIWENKETGDNENTFTQAQRIDFKRVKILITIITKDSDKDAKFELFQRLNTGGSSLTDQEVRNCLMLMTDENFYCFVRNLADDENFKSVLALSERQNDEKYDMELVCRYLAGKYTATNTFRNLSDISEFVNERMLFLSRDCNFNKEKEMNEFKLLFSILHSLDIHPFAKYNASKQTFEGMFLISAFEVIAIGLGKCVNKYSLSDSSIILEKIKHLWDNEAFLSVSGTGKSAKTRMSSCIDIGCEIFGK